jgi:hypothetical protein
MLSYVEVNDSALSVTQDHEHIQQSKANRWDDKKIYSNHIWHVILDEGSPGLRGRFRPVSTQESGHRSLGHFDTKFQQFSVNLWRTP